MFQDRFKDVQVQGVKYYCTNLSPNFHTEPYQPLLRWRTLTLLVQFDVSLDKVGQVMLYMNGSGAEMEPNTNRGHH